MRILNNNNSDYRVYKVELFVDNWDTKYSYTDDIIIDISNDDYNNNDDYISDLFKLIEQNYNTVFVYKINVIELYFFDNKLYRTYYTKEGEKITYEKTTFSKLNDEI